MKKIINAPETYTDDMLRGIYAAHSEVKYAADDLRCYCVAEKKPGKVAIITGGGTGEDAGETEVDDRDYGTLKVVDFADYDQLHKEDNGLISTAQAPVAADEEAAGPAIVWQAIEKSNVDMVEEMTAMMSSQRALQSAAQVLRMYDQIMSKSVTDIGRL